MRNTAKTIATIAATAVLAASVTAPVAAQASASNVICDALGIEKSGGALAVDDQRKVLKQLKREFGVRIGFCRMCGTWTTEEIHKNCYLCGSCQELTYCKKCEERAVDCSHWRRHGKKAWAAR